MSPLFKAISTYWFWGLVALLSAGWVAVVNGSEYANTFQQFLHPPGEVLTRIRINAVLAFALMLVLKGWRGPLRPGRNSRRFRVSTFWIITPSATTSLDDYVRRMAPRWKPLQRLTYAACMLTLIHWATLHDWGGIGPALVLFVPLALFETCRVWHWTHRNPKP